MRTTVLLLTTLLLTLALAGCAPRLPADRPSEPLVPGDARLDLRALMVSRSETSTLYLEQGGARQPFGTLSEALRVTDDGVVRIQRLETPRGSQLDSVAAARDFTPRSHFSQNPARTVDLRFGDEAATGTYHEAGREPVAIADALPAPAFDSNVVDLVARAVPLEVGWEQTVRTYERASADASETAVGYHIRVIGRQAIGASEAFVVEYAKAEGRPTRVYVEPGTRRVLRREAEVAPGVVLVIEPAS